MGRPKTEKADYERVEVRIPPELLEKIRRHAKAADRPVSAQLLRAIQYWADARLDGNQNHHVLNATPA